jgi:hypothetical protein
LAEGSIIFCARQQTRLAKRAGQKIVLQRQLSDLCMQGLHIDRRFRLGFLAVTEHLSRALEQLVTPLLDLVRLSVFAGKHLPVTDGRQTPTPTRSRSSRP